MIPFFDEKELGLLHVGCAESIRCNSWWALCYQSLFECLYNVGGLPTILSSHSVSQYTYLEHLLSAARFYAVGVSHGILTSALRTVFWTQHMLRTVQEKLWKLALSPIFYSGGKYMPLTKRLLLTTGCYV